MFLEKVGNLCFLLVLFRKKLVNFHETLPNFPNQKNEKTTQGKKKESPCSYLKIKEFCPNQHYTTNNKWPPR
jgi:hypothetical protein